MIYRDGRGRRMRNIIIQRPWRLLGYKYAYLAAYEISSEVGARSAGGSIITPVWLHADRPRGQAPR